MQSCEGEITDLKAVCNSTYLENKINLKTLCLVFQGQNNLKPVKFWRIPAYCKCSVLTSYETHDICMYLLRVGRN